MFEAHELLISDGSSEQGVHVLRTLGIFERILKFENTLVLTEMAMVLISDGSSDHVAQVW